MNASLDNYWHSHLLLTFKITIMCQSDVQIYKPYYLLYKVEDFWPS